MSDLAGLGAMAQAAMGGGGGAQQPKPRRRGGKGLSVADQRMLAAKKAEEQAGKYKALVKKYWELFDYKSADIFGHEPNYTFPGFRSTVGAFSSIFLFFAVFLRVTTTGSDFITSRPVISENRMIFPRDSNNPYTLPKVGLVFKQTGWRPFYDPTYFRFRFRQGASGQASNSSYVDLDDSPCSFVDVHGRIIEDEARCPSEEAHVLGGYFDTHFNFLHVSLLRCHNGTDADGRAQPGPCRTPAEIDELIWSGTVTVLLVQHDLEPSKSQKSLQLKQVKKQFRDGVHATYDMTFTVRQVTIQPRAYFDKFNPDAFQQFVILDRIDTSYTDFRAEKIGRWNKADPAYVPQYAAWYMLLGDEFIDQQRSWFSVFVLMERWGASCVFFYMVFSVIASRWNHWSFLQQVKGLDLRDLTRDQFDQFGRLVDTSFQVPRELCQMSV